jgi:hypothetical protein
MPFRVERNSIVCDACALDAATSRSMTAWGSMHIKFRVVINVLNEQLGSFFMPQCQHSSCGCLRQGG